MRLLLCACALAGCGGGDPAITDAPAAPDTPVPADAPDFGDPLAGIGNVEMVQGGFQFTEGPQWRETDGYLLFTDIPANTIYSYVPGSAANIFLMPSEMANGIAVDAGGAVYAARHGARDVTKAGASAVSRFEGKRLNSPNDVIVADDGTIYFTDPPYGISDAQRELDFMGVFRFANGTLTAEHRGALGARPNGIGLAPDGKTLYVADTSDGKLYRFAVHADGALGARTLHAQTAGSGDGLAIDTGGNILVATSAGIEVFSPTGMRWGAIAVPQQPANCAFGDPDHRTLYITARTALYKVRLAHAGLPRR